MRDLLEGPGGLYGAGSSSDADRERHIDDALFDLLAMETATARVSAWQRMRTLIRQRSPEKVAQMEFAKGLS